MSYFLFHIPSRPSIAVAWLWNQEELCCLFLSISVFLITSQGCWVDLEKKLLRIIGYDVVYFNKSSQFWYRQKKLLLLCLLASARYPSLSYIIAILSLGRPFSWDKDGSILCLASLVTPSLFIPDTKHFLRMSLGGTYPVYLQWESDKHSWY